MNYSHEKQSRRRVSEPVQVYLRPNEKDRLDRLTARLDATKSDILRRGLEALERQISDPEHHPALSIIGIICTTDDPGVDVAREHDEYLADSEAASWSDDRHVSRTFAGPPRGTATHDLHEPGERGSE